VFFAEAMSVVRLSWLSRRIYMTALPCWPSKEAQTLGLLGLATAKSGDAKRGRDFVYRAISVEPENPDLHLYAAWIYEDEGNWDGSVQELRKALSCGSNLSDSIKAEIRSRVEQLLKHKTEH
jgi:tetratricopeptide (TPR) repeat protein